MAERSVLMGSDSPMLQDALQDALHQALLSRGAGIALAVLSAIGKSHACKIEDTSHGLFLKVFYAQSRPKGSHGVRSTTSISTATPTSSQASAPEESPFTTPIPKTRLLLQRQSMRLPWPATRVPMKNTFVDFPEASDDSERTRSAPELPLHDSNNSDDLSPPGLEQLPRKIAFFDIGDTSAVGVQTEKMPQRDISVPQLSTGVQTQQLPKPRKSRVNGRACQTNDVTKEDVEARSLF